MISSRDSRGVDSRISQRERGPHQPYNRYDDSRTELKRSGSSHDYPGSKRHRSGVRPPEIPGQPSGNDYERSQRFPPQQTLHRRSQPRV